MPPALPSGTSKVDRPGPVSLHQPALAIDHSGFVSSIQSASVIELSGLVSLFQRVLVNDDQARWIS